MMRERYSCRKSIWRWLIMVVPPPAGKARGDGGLADISHIYHTEEPCSIGPAAAGGSRHSADNARHDRAVGGRFRLARTTHPPPPHPLHPAPQLPHLTQP